MSEEKDGSGSKKVCFNEDWCALIRGGGPDPENGQAGVEELFGQASDAASRKYINFVVNGLLDNIQDKHLPSTKLLLDIANLLTKKDSTAVEFESFAQVLFNEFLKEQKELEQQEKTQEQEARITIQGERGSFVVEPCGE